MIMPMCLVASIVGVVLRGQAFALPPRIDHHRAAMKQKLIAT
jgi:hypothetical protein